METNRITPGQSNPPSQVGGTQQKSGEEAFHDMAKSQGYNKGDVEQAVSERTRLTRTKKADKASRKTTHALFLVGDEDEEASEQPVYRTVMVDGMIFTLRLLAVA